MRIKTKDWKYLRSASYFPHSNLMVLWYERRDIAAEWCSIHHDPDFRSAFRGKNDGHCCEKVVFFSNYNRELEMLLKNLTQIEIWYANQTNAADERGLRLETILGRLKNGVRMEWTRVVGVTSSDVEAVWDCPQLVPELGMSTFADRPVKKYD